MKSRNLTQSSLRNDPINLRMQGFSFRIDEDENLSSRCDFFLLFRSKFDFKHSIEAEMSQEHYETNGTRIEALHRENLMTNRERFLSAQRTSLIKTILILGRPMKVHSDQRSRSRVRWSNRHLKFFIVGFRSYGFIWSEIHRVRIISTVITVRSDGGYWFTLMDFKHVLDVRSGGLTCAIHHNSIGRSTLTWKWKLVPHRRN